MRIWVGCPALLDLPLLAAAGHQVVPSTDGADLAIGFTSVPDRVPPPRIIMLYLEPPLGGGYTHVYNRAQEFRAFGSLVDHPAANSFLLTQDPIAYPYGYGAFTDLRRSDTRLTTRRVFYAGTRTGYQPGGEGDYGRVALYHIRNCVVEGLRQAGVDVYAEGVGWPTASRLRPDWAAIKAERLEAVGADFHLCMENSMLPNYISEKIHHGFQSDRVVLYLGCSRIASWVPLNAFIDLSRRFDLRSGVLNLLDVVEDVLYMPQEEYDAILHAARAWRETARLQERFLAERTRVTKVVLERL